MRRLGILAATLAMAVSIAVPGLALAVEPNSTQLAVGQVNASSLAAQADDIIDGGTFGSCDWDVYQFDDGSVCLYISPSNGRSVGYLESTFINDDEDETSSVPWYSHRNEITSVIVDDRVVAAESCAGMFCDCPNLEWANLSGLDTSNTTSMYAMFWGCTKLSTIWVSSLWSNEYVQDCETDAMFFGCESLVGGNGTECACVSAESDDFSYGSIWANVDEADNLGYLTSCDVADATITLSATSYTYDGTAKKPHVTLRIGDYTLAADEYTVSYSDNVNAGTATVTINGDSIYVGSRKVTFKITPAAITEAALSATSYTYNGKVQKPSVRTVKAGALTLASSHYTVSYATASKAAGTYKVTISGKGNFNGTRTLTYKIKQAKNSVTVGSGQVKSTQKRSALKGKAQTIALPKAKAKFGSAKWVVAKKDAKKVLTLSGKSIKVKKGAKKGTYTIKLKAKVKGTKSYKGAVSKPVTVKVVVK